MLIKEKSGKIYRKFMCTRPEDACMHVHTPSPLHTHIYKQLTPPLEYIDSYPMPLKLRSPDYLNCPTETTDKNEYINSYPTSWKHQLSN